MSPKGDACWYIADPFSFSASTYRKNNIPEGTTPPGTWQNPAETGLYYLQSRYYNPEIGRFLNADGYVSTGQGVLGYNMFAYCENNPVIRVDAHGYCYYTAGGIWAHDAWENLGGYEKKPDPNAIDITEKLNVAMVDHAIELYEYAEVFSPIEAAVLFADNVRGGGNWDLKAQDDWGLVPNQAYRYNNMLLRYDDIGNIHYGYVGSVLFGPDILLLAGGIVQVFSGSSSLSYITSNFDDPRDQWAIWYGTVLWDSGD